MNIVRIRIYFQFRDQSQRENINKKIYTAKNISTEVAQRHVYRYTLMKWGTTQPTMTTICYLIRKYTGNESFWRVIKVFTSIFQKLRIIEQTKIVHFHKILLNI